MLTLAAFASLAQLGSGLALALAIFIEPITLREQRYRRKLDGALKLLLRDGSERSQIRENEIWTKIINLDAAVKSAHKLAKPGLTFIKIGAMLNFIILLLATIIPDSEVSDGWALSILLICILPVAIGTLWLEGIARVKIGKLEG